MVGVESSKKSATRPLSIVTFSFRGISVISGVPCLSGLYEVAYQDLFGSEDNVPFILNKNSRKPKEMN